MAPGSTYPLTEMSTINVPGSKGRPHRRLSTDVSTENVGASTSHNPMGLHGILHVHYRTFLIMDYPVCGLQCSQSATGNSRTAVHIFMKLEILRRAAAYRPPVTRVCEYLELN
jgi:hypothetical protein